MTKTKKNIETKNRKHHSAIVDLFRIMAKDDIGAFILFAVGLAALFYSADKIQEGLSKQQEGHKARKHKIEICVGEKEYDSGSEIESCKEFSHALEQFKQEKLKMAYSVGKSREI